jgi:putative membrane protein
MGLIISLIVNTLAVFVTDYILPGVSIDNLTTTVVVAIVLGVLNTLIKPILVLLTLPINLVTLGLFTFVINALLVLFADWLIPGFAVDGFLWALIFSLVLSIVSAFLNSLVKH